MVDWYLELVWDLRLAAQLHGLCVHANQFHVIGNMLSVCRNSTKTNVANLQDTEVILYKTFHEWEDTQA